MIPKIWKNPCQLTFLETQEVDTPKPRAKPKLSGIPKLPFQNLWRAE